MAQPCRLYISFYLCVSQRGGSRTQHPLAQGREHMSILKAEAGAGRGCEHDRVHPRRGPGCTDTLGLAEAAPQPEPR